MEPGAASNRGPGGCVAEASEYDTTGYCVVARDICDAAWLIVVAMKCSHRMQKINSC